MKEDLQDLVTSKGWSQVTKLLEKRRARYVSQLISHTDAVQLRMFQSAVREIDYFLKCPHEILQGVSNEKI